jgi:dihydrofolate reductase
MGRVVAYTLTSLDGAVEDPSLYFPASSSADDPFQLDAESEAFEAETIGRQTAVLLGRRMYDEWVGFWPTVTGNPFATFINEVPKHVVTSRPLTRSWSGARTVSGDLSEAVRRIASGTDGDVGVHGSIRLLRSLLGLGLVDELRLVVGPVAGAPGPRLLDGLATPLPLRLVRAASTSNGNLLLTYEPVRSTLEG